MGRSAPRYPIYIPSKGRYKTSYTADYLSADGIPFTLVVEPQEVDPYAEKFGANRILVLPENNQGVIFARNYIKDHATELGSGRHWQLDDNIRYFYRHTEGRRIRVNSGAALAVAEDFTDRYENIAISGLNYDMFAPPHSPMPPFYRNCRVYSCSLIDNSIPHRWRVKYNEDTDICLQVLADGYCTVLINAFLIKKVRTMMIKGGNTDNLYQGDGRLKMARSLERLHPGVVKVRRRFGRPQHIVFDAWKRFDTPLKLKPGIDLEQLSPDDYGLQLIQVKPEIKSPALRDLLQQGS